MCIIVCCVKSDLVQLCLLLLHRSPLLLGCLWRTAFGGSKSSNLGRIRLEPFGAQCPQCQMDPNGAFPADQTPLVVLSWLLFIGGACDPPKFGFNAMIYIYIYNIYIHIHI